MKKTVKFVSICLVLIIVCLAVSSCVSEDDIVGVWRGIDMDGSVVLIQIKDIGLYERWEYSLLEGLKFLEQGDWEIKGNKVILYDIDATTFHGMGTVFTYKDDVLTSGELELRRHEK